MIRTHLRTAALALALASATSLTSFSAVAPARAEAEAPQARLVKYEDVQDLGALASEGKTVVFFFATWCPNCILTLTELSTKWSEVEPDLTLVIADYDQETALKAKYGVTYQDTFVLLDSSGDAAKLWNAGGVAGLNENTRAQ
ncbi:thioredoxin family protein [Aureimonas fodinaquatilis]|uniref:Thioredoxin family protein n=1 Tax=Aureimonas fodinaquatilis TaxID=2565783 RepID=A0A5B0DT95_9HYPH|nr:thioredoxin family protein [Aureimonas fodinaquatilis]KAA0969633.1 thioredoxin family protein [Aureimonas fodinaquatilis]